MCTLLYWIITWTASLTDMVEDGVRYTWSWVSFVLYNWPLVSSLYISITWDHRMNRPLFCLKMYTQDINAQLHVGKLCGHSKTCMMFKHLKGISTYPEVPWSTCLWSVDIVSYCLHKVGSIRDKINISVLLSEYILCFEDNWFISYFVYSIQPLIGRGFITSWCYDLNMIKNKPSSDIWCIMRHIFSGMKTNEI